MLDRSFVHSLSVALLFIPDDAKNASLSQGKACSEKEWICSGIWSSNSMSTGFKR